VAGRVTTVVRAAGLASAVGQAIGTAPVDAGLGGVAAEAAALHCWALALIGLVADLVLATDPAVEGASAAIRRCAAFGPDVETGEGLTAARRSTDLTVTAACVIALGGQALADPADAGVLGNSRYSSSA